MRRAHKIGSFDDERDLGNLFCSHGTEIPRENEVAIEIPHCGQGTEWSIAIRPFTEDFLSPFNPNSGAEVVT